MCYGLTDYDIAFDTSIAEYVLDPSRNKYELKNLTLERLHCDINIDEENQGDKQLDMFHDNRAHMTELGLKTGAAVYALEIVSKRNSEEQGLKKVFQEAELPLIEVLASMEAEE